MSWAGGRQLSPYPYGDDERARAVKMPVDAPVRATRRPRRAPRTRKVPGCPGCAGVDWDAPCQRHASVDVLASIGIASRAGLSPDEYVRWEPV